MLLLFVIVDPIMMPKAFVKRGVVMLVEYREHFLSPRVLEAAVDRICSRL